MTFNRVLVQIFRRDDFDFHEVSCVFNQFQIVLYVIYNYSLIFCLISSVTKYFGLNVPEKIKCSRSKLFQLCSYEISWYIIILANYNTKLPLEYYNTLAEGIAEKEIVSELNTTPRSSLNPNIVNPNNLTRSNAWPITVRSSLPEDEQVVFKKLRNSKTRKYFRKRF